MRVLKLLLTIKGDLWKIFIYSFYRLFDVFKMLPIFRKSCYHLSTHVEFTNNLWTQIFGKILSAASVEQPSPSCTIMAPFLLADTRLREQLTIISVITAVKKLKKYNIFDDEN